VHRKGFAPAQALRVPRRGRAAAGLLV